MLANFIKIAIRSLSRNRFFTAINVLGLSLGVAFALLAITYLRHEITWDHHITNYQNVYRIDAHSFPHNRSPYYSTQTCSLLKPEIDGKIPGLEPVTRVSTNNMFFRKEGEIFPIYAAAVDSSYFSTFDLKLLKGDPSTALSNPTGIVVSKEFADKYFRDTDVIGEFVNLELDTGFTAFEITGLFADPPKNASHRYEAIYEYEVDYAHVRSKYLDDWGLTWSSSYVRLTPGTSPESVESAIADIVGQAGVDTKENGDRIAWELQPISTTHVTLNNPRGFPTETEANGIVVLSGIALIILILASINFTTLTVGHSTIRATEVGMRKVLGASRARLMIQFWLEAGIVTMLGVLFGILLAKLALPEFNDLAQRTMSLTFNGSMVAILLGVWFAVVLATGSYPSLIISSFKPVDAFKGEVKLGGKARLRKSLIFLQFVLSILFVTGTIVMNQQLNYVSNQSLGYNGDQVVMIEAKVSDNSTEVAMERLRSKLISDPRILSVSGAANGMDNDWFILGWETDDGGSYRDIRANAIDPLWLETMEIPIIAGKGFDPNRDPSGGIAEVIINKQAVEFFELDDPIGKPIPTYEGLTEIVGVIPDIHMESLHQEIRPTILMRSIRPLWGENRRLSLSMSNWMTIQRIFVRISGEDIPGTLYDLEATWRKVAPDKSFDYSFVDESVGALYKEDRRWNSIVNWASGMALFIAALGLIGLSTLEVARRRREIGIRKVLGASETSIVVLLTKQITLIVAVATVVAAPLSWIFMQRWLDNFAYRITLLPFWMLLAGLITMAIAWFCVGSLAWRSASANPVDAIRHE